MWALPAFSPEVPLEISQADAQASALAKFMLLAHQRGIKLPVSNFTTTSDAMAAQFAAYALEHTSRLFEKLPLQLTLTVADGQIELAGWAQSNLDIYKLKDPIERLNAALPGLGWYISKSIARGHQMGMATYDPSRAASMVEHIWFESQTDIEMASEVLGIAEEEVDADAMERALQERGGVMPSGVLASFGGHKNLLGWSMTDDERADCPSLDESQVKAAVQSLDLRADDRELLMAALEVSELAHCKADKKLAPEGWFVHENEGDGQVDIGALAFVVWDNQDLTCELVQHYEEYAMSGEGGSEQLLCLRIELDEPASWKRFIEAYKLLIKRYAAFSKLLGALPKGE